MANRGPRDTQQIHGGNAALLHLVDPPCRRGLHHRGAVSGQRLGTKVARKERPFDLTAGRWWSSTMQLGLDLVSEVIRVIFHNLQ